MWVFARRRDAGGIGVFCPVCLRLCGGRAWRGAGCPRAGSIRGTTFLRVSCCCVWRRFTTLSLLVRLNVW